MGFCKIADKGRVKIVSSPIISYVVMGKCRVRVFYALVSGG